MRPFCAVIRLRSIGTQREKERERESEGERELHIYIYIYIYIYHTLLGYLSQQIGA